MLDYLVIGHITADLQPDGGLRPGGTALYAALAAHRLGLRTAIVTACAPELDLAWLPPDLIVLRQAATQSTTFSNQYLDNARIQHIHAVAPPINLGDLPSELRTASIVHLGPVVHEMPAVAQFPVAFVGVTPQGWLRRWDRAGLVELVPQRLATLPWQGVAVVVVSEEDVAGDEALVVTLATHVPTVALTRAERGATVWHAGQRYDVPALPAHVVDPTGAGDVWAAAFMIALYQNQAVVDAARWAHAAAAYAIEAEGVAGLPTPIMVEQRLGEDRA